jgi:hypothetical protein
VWAFWTHRLSVRLPKRLPKSWDVLSLEGAPDSGRDAPNRRKSSRVFGRLTRHNPFRVSGTVCPSFSLNLRQRGFPREALWGGTRKALCALGRVSAPVSGNLFRASEVLESSQARAWGRRGQAGDQKRQVFRCLNPSTRKGHPLSFNPFPPREPVPASLREPRSRRVSAGTSRLAVRPGVNPNPAPNPIPQMQRCRGWMLGSKHGQMRCG